MFPEACRSLYQLADIYETRSSSLIHFFLTDGDCKTGVHAILLFVKPITMSIMNFHILVDALQGDSRLRFILSQITPAHTLDIIATVFLAALGVAYLFPKWTWDKPDPYEFIYYEKPQSGEVAGGASNTTRNISKRIEDLVCQPSPPFQGTPLLISTG